MKFLLDLNQVVASTEKLKRLKYDLEPKGQFTENAFKDLLTGLEFITILGSDLKRVIKAFDLLDLGVIKLTLDSDCLTLEQNDFMDTKAKTKLTYWKKAVNEAVCKYSVEYLKAVFNSFKFKANDRIELGFKTDNPLVLRINGVCVVIAPRIDME